MEYRAVHRVATRPDPEDLAVFVRFQRQVLGWKTETLASFATVSLSTIERVERGDKVGSECLDRIAVALGYKQGDFTEARVPLASQDAALFLDQCLLPFKGKRWIDAAPIRKQAQIIAFGRCHGYLIDGGRLEAPIEEDIAGLREELDFVGFARDDTLNNRSERESRRLARRRLYTEVLAHIREIENQSHALALGGTYEASTSHPLLPRVRVAVIGFFPKTTDPGAIRRRQLLVPERVSLSTKDIVGDTVSRPSRRTE